MAIKVWHTGICRHIWATWPSDKLRIPRWNSWCFWLMADLYLLDYCRTTVQCRDAVIVQHLLVCIPEIVQGNLFKVAVGDLGTEDRCSVMISDRHTWRDSWTLWDISWSISHFLFVSRISKFSNALIHINPYESILIHINPYQSIWIHINPYESIWIHINPYESIWIHINPY